MAKKKATKSKDKEKKRIEVDYVPVRDVQLAKYNPKKHDAKQFKRLSFALVEHEWILPIVVNKRTSNVVDGNQRIKHVLKNYGDDYEVPVIFIDVPLGKEKSINIGLNTTSTPVADDLFKQLLEDAEVEQDALIDDLRKDLDRATAKTAGQQLEPEYRIVQEADEQYDYILMLFNRGLDFTNACDFFNVTDVYDLNRNRKVGLGRAIKGDDLLKLVEFARKHGANSIEELE